MNRDVIFFVLIAYLNNRIVTEVNRKYVRYHRLKKKHFVLYLNTKDELKCCRNDFKLMHHFEKKMQTST